VSGFLAKAAASAARNAAKWRREYALSSLPPRGPRPRFLAGEGFSLIAEVKRRSPSRGPVMPPGASPASLARLYLGAGAGAVSVITEEEHFGGSPAVFAEVAGAVPLPLLWKDFVVDPFQVELAAAMGASAVLLIAALLPGEELGRFLALGRGAGVRPLVEVHSRDEVERAVEAGADLVGVNHRDLRTLEMDMTLTERLAPLLAGRQAVAESGLSRPADAARMRALGYRAILVGTALASSPDPAGEARTLLGKGKGWGLTRRVRPRKESP